MNESSLQAFSEIVLPPGSTSTDLQEAIDNATSGDTIVISGDMPFTDTVAIPEGKEITIQSDDGNNWTLTYDYRCFYVTGSLILNNITLHGTSNGAYVTDGGSLTMNNGAVIQNSQDSGVQVWNNSRLTMNYGAVIKNCTAGAGGGVYLDRSAFDMTGGTIRDCWVGDGGAAVFVGSGSTFTMSGGELTENSVYGRGGAVEITDDDSTFVMSGGKITGNFTESTIDYDGGGGIYIQRGTFLISGGEISGNSSAIDGGGIYNVNGTINMSGGKISRNTASGNGGGIYLCHDDYESGTLNVSGGEISNNTATVSGGGVYTPDLNYRNITTDIDTIFRCNKAAAAYAPPADAAELYPNFKFSSTTITEHLLNNYDINYTVGTPITPTYHVTYKANGGIGSYKGAGVALGGNDTVPLIEDTGISREGYTFTGWNTEPDGSGTEYAPGVNITVDCNTILYAQWVADERFTITYGSNGGIGSFEDSGRQYGTNYTVLSPIQAGISRSGFTFAGWNTQPDGSGASFAPGDIITITGDVRLYAQWRQNPTPEPISLCPKSVTKCRMAIEGQKTWIDDDNKDNTRPDKVEILLLRDEEAYDRRTVDSENGWAYGFCCLPVWKNSGNKYVYRIDEVDVPRYTKKIEGYNVTNTFTP